MAAQHPAPRHRADVFVPRSEDPRKRTPSDGGERETLQDYLAFHRATLRLKCEGLDAEQLARRSVPPSTMSLLGLVRHMAHVERVWFRIRVAGEDLPRLYQTSEQPDGDFDGAIADPAVVDQAWRDWEHEMARTDDVIDGWPQLDDGFDLGEETISMRDLLVHMIEEYARHNGHADLLRECIDGRVGQ